MAHGIPESDWKIFKELHTAALNRCCEKTLQEISKLAADTAKTPHQRYQEIFRYSKDRNRDIAAEFDDSRRSTAVSQLTVLFASGWITASELERLSPETREAIGRWQPPRS